MAVTSAATDGSKAAADRSADRASGRRSARGGLVLLLLVAPSIIVLLLINGYPLVYAAVQSVHSGNLLATGNLVGFKNYATVLTSGPFWRATEFTLIFTLVGVFGSWIIGMALALALQTRIPGGGLIKVLLLLPWVVPIVVSSTAWNWLVATPDSPLPAIARALGMGTPLFLADPTLAQVTVCVFKVWVSFPFMMLMMSAALSSVDESVYEASALDGATRRQQLVFITLPLIARSIYISWILMTIFCVNDFPTIYLLTGGGPVSATTTLIVLAFQTVFQSFRTGPGTAIAFLMTGTLVLISLALFRLIQKSAVEQ
jgi:multiple sugar transport system permease protein